MRIAYVSHVDSKWIKQRPHFIAEAMSSESVHVAYVCSMLVRRSLLVSTQTLKIPVLRVPILPQSMRRRLRIFDPIASMISAIMIIIFLRPAIVIFTHSRHRRIAKYLHYAKIRVFYDCMDLNNHFSDALIGDEKDECLLVQIAERTFSSSKAIANHITSLNSDSVVEIIPNALQPSSFKKFSNDRPRVQPLVVGYIGAISSWLDFESIQALLESNAKIIVRLWGPSDVAIPEHERLEVMGVVGHNEALEAMHGCGVLVLPFILSELILAVDPVKVYEYIASGRPTVVRDYSQLNSFGTLVHRYTSPNDFVSTVEAAMRSKPVDRQTLSLFMEENSWDKRARQVLKCIE